MSAPGRLLIDEPLEGAWNMAVDEALLRTTAESNVWTLRFYRWSSPVLSLGYFQQYADRKSHEASQEVDCVRRSTGGGAIVHDHEITYSLVCPSADRFSRDNESLYFAVHGAIQSSLAEFGIDVGLHPSVPIQKHKRGDNRHEPFLCFQRRTHGDIIFGEPGAELKICGSAQRRYRNAVLQHGSLIFRTSEFAPEIPGLLDLAGSNLNEAAFLQDLTARLEAELNISFAPGSLREEQSKLAAGIEADRFRAPAWIKKR